MSEASGTKQCRKCKAVKALSAFNRSAYHYDGLRYECAECTRKEQKVRRGRIAEKNRAKWSAAEKVVPPERKHAKDMTGEELREFLQAVGISSPPPAVTEHTHLQEHYPEWQAAQPPVVPQPEPVPAPVIPSVEPQKSPLESAYEERATARQHRLTTQQRNALLDENERLKNEIQSILATMKAPDILVYRQPSWERSDAIAMGLASDWHIEEPVEKASVHGLNEFNLEIARSRSEKFFVNLLRLTDICARDSKITTILLNGLGDFFSGWIHEELLANTLLAPAEASLFCKGLWFSGIDFLLRESSYIIEGDLIPGNHGRLTKQVHFGNPTGTSLETVMYASIVDRYHDNPRVRLKVASQSMVYRKLFEKFVLRLIHGYETKYLGGVGGVTIPLNKAIAQWDIPIRADLTCLGHYHQFFDGGRFLMNGSLIGYNLFAQNIKAAFEEARQAFTLIVARNGGTRSLTAPIWLDSAHKDHGLVEPISQEIANEAAQ